MQATGLRTVLGNSVRRHNGLKDTAFVNNWKRSYAISSAKNPYYVFNRENKLEQRNRAVATPEKVEHSRLSDYVRDNVAATLVDRLLDINRRFPHIVDLGSGAGHIIKNLNTDITKKVTMIDSSKTLFRDADIKTPIPVERIVGDEEDPPLKPESEEAIMSCLSLHWVNDLPGVLSRINKALVPDGMFLGAMLGGDTLFELRTSLQLAEMERHGGLSQHVSPMTDTRDLSHLISRAGFTLPTIDVDEIQINYPSIFELCEDLQAMGESNAVGHRHSFLRRDTLLAASAIYKELHGNEDGSIPATFQILYMIGWKYSPNQQKPLPRGSAEKSLKDL